MGATAVRGVLRRSVSISSVRGEVLRGDEDAQVIVTIHPSFVLRQQDDDSREREYKGLVTDLRRCAKLLAA
jgi:DNA polymerase